MKSTTILALIAGAALLLAKKSSTNIPEGSGTGFSGSTGALGGGINSVVAHPEMITNMVELPAESHSAKTQAVVTFTPANQANPAYQMPAAVAGSSISVPNSTAYQARGADVKTIILPDGRPVTGVAGTSYTSKGVTYNF